ncbi:hypothetical protein SORBI_3010G197566 [Sorghum bicolor]|uniref:Uncharacterized protein n=1 Tax=Sorghum bicolor TaxID=4558 RepID=A0A1W0VU00_SORBI|nr:hypothetical protein SORBI_3010G197566 [Sorghum bicolor]OQU76740.1 hypothetical protein SORBI_3010G197566 [Sorghum bicolor]
MKDDTTEDWLRRSAQRAAVAIVRRRRAAICHARHLSLRRQDRKRHQQAATRRAWMLGCDCSTLEITQYNVDTQHARTLTPMNTHHLEHDRDARARAATTWTHVTAHGRLRSLFASPATPLGGSASRRRARRRGAPHAAGGAGSGRREAHAQITRVGARGRFAARRLRIHTTRSVRASDTDSVPSLRSDAS